MPFFTSGTLIRIFSLYHITLAYFLVSSPTTLANHPLVSILGEAMRIPSFSTSLRPNSTPNNQGSPFHQPAPPAQSLVEPAPATALAGLFLALIAIIDFTAGALPDEAYLTHWIAQTTVRLPVFFVLCVWVYLFKPVEDPMAMGVWGEAGWAGEAKNSLVFTLGFVEVVWLFWVSFKKLVWGSMHSDADWADGMPESRSLLIKYTIL